MRIFDAIVSEELTSTNRLQIPMPAVNVTFDYSQIQIAPLIAMRAVCFAVIGVFVILKAQRVMMVTQVNEPEIFGIKSFFLVAE